MFQGFQQEAVDFLWGIRLNNDRAWFQAHRREFESYVDGPLRALAGEVYEEMARRFPKVPLQMHVSRIYRDARRLFGRGPYKDTLWFVLGQPGSEGTRTIPAFYFGLAPEYYGIGMGYYEAAPAVMARFRARIDRDPREMSRLARRLARQDRFILSGEMYKRPKGDPGRLLSPWYNRRNLSLDCEQNCEGTLFTPELAEEVLEGFAFLMPYYIYLRSLPGDPDPNEGQPDCQKGEA